MMVVTNSMSVGVARSAETGPSIHGEQYRSAIHPACSMVTSRPGQEPDQREDEFGRTYACVWGGWERSRDRRLVGLLTVVSVFDAVPKSPGLAGTWRVDPNPR